MPTALSKPFKRQQLISILQCFYSQVKVHYLVISTQSMPSAVAVHLIPVNFMCGALTVITQSGGLYPVGTVAAQSVRTMKPVDWIDRQQSKLLPVPYFLATFTLPYQLPKD